MHKVLHVAFVAPENGFDPQASSDLYSNYVNRQVFDPLYKYDYLARPFKVVPNTAAALPEISADGLTWTIRIKRGIYFSDDPAFGGKKRELTADDYVYSFKRLIDPKLRSNNAQILDDRLVGAKAAIDAAKKSGAFDYDAPFEGAHAIDRYTLQLKLTFPAYDLLPDLTGSSTTAVAREVVKAYGDANGWVMEHPVGTGPYRLDGMAPRAEDRAGGESEFPRRVLSGQRAAGGPRARGEDAGQEAARDRPRRDQHHRGVDSAIDRVRSG